MYVAVEIGFVVVRACAMCDVVRTDETVAVLTTGPRDRPSPPSSLRILAPTVPHNTFILGGVRAVPARSPIFYSNCIVVPYVAGQGDIR